MLSHYFTTALRNLFRNRLFTSINIVGLSVSIAIFLALTSYVGYQFSYDKFFPQSDRIYRINYFEYQGGQPVLETSRTHSRTALLMHEYVPQVESVTRMYHEKAFVWTEDVKLVDQDMMFVDSSFLKVFDLKLINGDRETALKAPLSVMISKSQADAYFPGVDPMGKTLYFNEKLPFVVTGIFEDLPANTSIYFDFLLSWSTITYYGWGKRDGDFETPSSFTFIKLKKNANDSEPVNQALSKMVDENILSLKLRGHTGKYSLMPLHEQHTSKGLSGEIKPGTNKSLLYALLSLGIFILVAAWINYINLSVARLLERADEIGVRKVFGASRLAISGQFFLEAIILSFFTFFTGYLIYLYFTSSVSEWLAMKISFLSDNGTILLYLVGFVIGTTLIAFYPAYFVSRYKPVLILKNKLGNGRGRSNFLYQALMVFQLFLSITVVGITLIADRQISYMREFDSGFNSKQTVALRAPASTNSDSLRYSRYPSFRKEVLQYPEFRSGTSSFNIPGEEIRFHDEGVHAVGSTNEKKQSFKVLWIDEGFKETFGLSLLGGRNFNEKEFGTTCLINETAALALGYPSANDAVNTEIIMRDDKKLTVIGVFKDYHHESIRKGMDPIIFVHLHPFEYGYYSFSVDATNGEFIKRLGQIWNKHYPNDQFVYYFMDRFFEEQYRQDELFGQLLNIFSIISIAVASLGLFGMASISMVKRTKEIAVRKVLGATVMNLLVMLSSSYVKLIVIGCAFAFPLAYYLAEKWLNDFTYRINVHWWMILVPGIVVLITTLLTIGGQAIRAALANPAKTLRDQ